LNDDGEREPCLLFQPRLSSCGKDQGPSFTTATATATVTTMRTPREARCPPIFEQWWTDTEASCGLAERWADGRGHTAAQRNSKWVACAGGCEGGTGSAIGGGLAAT
jgi:hypothetical protein